ncbi:MAG: hypothetical protein FJ276_31185 [Planctomycetes bacterium]|nr:hypothetical protein [Planctomycetota bacterium]
MKEPTEVFHCYSLTGENVALCVYEEGDELMLKTAAGWDVRRLAKGHYRIICTELEFFCDAPHAP